MQFEQSTRSKLSKQSKQSAPSNAQDSSAWANWASDALCAMCPGARCCLECSRLREISPRGNAPFGDRREVMEDRGMGRRARKLKSKRLREREKTKEAHDAWRAKSDAAPA
jgi:hypothetical protein